MKKLFTYFSMALATIMLGASMFTFGACKHYDFNVGIIQLVEHEALGASNKGFQDELKKLMKDAGKTVGFKDKNASGEQSNCITIANTLVNNKVDLILAIATPAAQAAVAATDTIPVLFTAVTDAVEAGLDAQNVSGTSDLNPIKDQLDIMKELVPSLTKIATIYTTSEKNSEFQVDYLQTECDKCGIELVKKGVEDTNNLEATFLSLSSDVQCVYLPTDNALAKAAATVNSANISSNKKLPIVCGEIGMNRLCGIATYGINYYELGKQTAHMAYKILMEGGDISKMPVEHLENIEFSVSQDIASEIGFTIPQSILDKISQN